MRRWAGAYRIYVARGRAYGRVHAISKDGLTFVSVTRPRSMRTDRSGTSLAVEGAVTQCPCQCANSRNL